MTELVVDASVLIQYLITDTQTELARAFFDGIQEEDRVWIPEFCLLECTNNVLWKQVRFQHMPKEQAQMLVKDLRAMPLHITPAESLLDTALQNALDHTLAVYDSVYIALAQSLNIPLISADSSQIAAAKSARIQVTSLTDFK